MRYAFLTIAAGMGLCVASVAGLITAVIALARDEDQRAADDAWGVEW